MAADLRLGQPYRAQLTVTVGGEAARRERLPATWRCSPCKAAPEGLVMVTPEQSSSPPMRAPIIRIAPSTVDARIVDPARHPTVGAQLVGVQRRLRRNGSEGTVSATSPAGERPRR